MHFISFKMVLVANANAFSQATKEEINNAYRQYSKLFHPDKHQSEEKKLKADILFNKIKRAHES